MDKRKDGVLALKTVARKNCIDAIFLIFLKIEQGKNNLIIYWTNYF